MGGQVKLVLPHILRILNVLVMTNGLDVVVKKIFPYALILTNLAYRINNVDTTNVVNIHDVITEMDVMHMMDIQDAT